MYFHGAGGEQNYEKAEELYRKVCDTGDTAGCSGLGSIYMAKKNYGKAKESFKKACDGGGLTACSNLGLMYAEGKGVNPNMEKAKEFLNEACVGGLGEGCSTIGAIYEMEKNYGKAKEFFKKGCDNGYEDGCKYYIEVNEKYSSASNIPSWAILIAGTLFLLIILALIFGRKNEKVKDALGWIIGIPLIALFWYFSTWLTTWWTAFKLSFFGF